MASGWLIVVAVVLGAGVGVAVTLLVVQAGRARERIAQTANPAVPSGLARIIDAIGAEAFVLDAGNVVVRVSDSAREHGVEEGEILDQPDLVDLLRQLRLEGHVDPIEYRSGERHLSARAVIVGPRHVLVMINDETESRRVEALRRDFVANVSHELKTPIGAVAVLAEAISMAARDPDRVEAFAGQLVSQAERLTQLTTEVIALSRVQQGDVPDELKSLKVDQLVDEAIERLRIPAADKGISLVRGKRSRARVLGDRENLIVAVGNLVSNAIRYSPDRSRVGVGVTVHEEMIEISVTDQGIGIPAAEQERIFERFYRVDAARSRSTGGTGLGLSIVKHTVQNHGGEVTLWSMPGAGSTFTIRLPEYRHNEPDLTEKRGREDESATAGRA